MISRTSNMSLLRSADVKFQLKFRLKTVKLYRVMNVRIVLPSVIAWFNNIRQTCFKSQIKMCDE